jgi:hypothetical protein
MLEKLTQTITTNTLHADRLAGALEALALALATRAAAWVACVPTVMLTARSIETVFTVTPRAALSSAVALEIVGQGVVNTWLQAKEWNATKRKSDPRANAPLALGLMIAYFVSDFVLIGVLEIPKALGDPIHWAALLFPAAQVISTVVTAERAAQFRRTEEVAQEKRARAQKRAHRRAQKRAQVAQRDAQRGRSDVHRTGAQDAQNGALSAVNRTRQEQKATAMDALIGQFAQDPRMPITDAARAVGVHRNTVYNYLEELEAEGRVKRNGGGVEVLA